MNLFLTTVKANSNGVEGRYELIIHASDRKSAEAHLRENMASIGIAGFRIVEMHPTKSKVWLLIAK
jgi:hypothetical protein